MGHLGFLGIGTANLDMSVVMMLTCERVRLQPSAYVCVRLRARADDHNRSCTGVHARTSTRITAYTLFNTHHADVCTCARIYVRVEFQAARPLACASVRVCLRALAGCCVYASAAKDASIA